MDKHLAIVYITDEAYVDYTVTSIKSVLLTAQNEVHIYVICNSVSEGGKKRLLVDPCIDIIDYHGDVEHFGAYRYVSASAFIKFDIPNLIPDDKCLYIDGDTIAVNDVTSIFDYDLSDFLAGVMEDFGRHFIWKTESEGDKFYAGTMLLNLKRMREENTVEQLYLEKEKHPDTSIWNEMEIFNIVLDGKVLHLPVTYCVSIEKIMFGKHKEYRDISLYNSLYGSTYQSIAELVSDAVIFHFHGDKTKVYDHREFYDLIDKVEEEYLARGGRKAYVFSNVCRFKDADDLKQEISKLGIDEKDVLIFLNTAPWLTKFFDVIPKATIVTLHRFKRNSRGWWGLDDILSLPPQEKQRIKTFLLDNAGNISTLDSRPIATASFLDYPRESNPTTGFFAVRLARQYGLSDIRLVNFYGTRDKSTPHFKAHGWNYEETALKSEKHIHLEPGQTEILFKERELKLNNITLKKTSVPTHAASAAKGIPDSPRIYYGSRTTKASFHRESGWNW